MDFSQNEQATIASYDDHAEQWVSDHNTPGYWGQWMDTFRSYLHAGKILEIGAGGGRDAKELLVQGYEYVGIDVSRGLLEIARRELPHVPFLHQSVYDLDFPDDSFDGFWSAATLLHVPKSKIDRALSEIHRVVKNNGIGFISLKKNNEGSADESVDDSEKMHRFFVYYSENEFLTVLERNHFDVLRMDALKKSERTTWLVFIVRIRK